jgi:hypothetical protein
MISKCKLYALLLGLGFTFAGDLLALFGVGIQYQGYLLSWSFASQNVMVVLIVIYCMRHQDEDWHPVAVACIALASLVILPIELIMQM